MSEVVPRYAKQFEFIVVKNFGHKKLQTLLESEMGDLVQVGVDTHTHARTHTCAHTRVRVHSVQKLCSPLPVVGVWLLTNA